MTTTAELLTRYEQSCATHGVATTEGDADAANRAHDVIASAFCELRARNEVHLLEGLLTSTDVGVRLWAATHLLEHAPEKGTPVLEEIAAGPFRLLSFSAKMALREWALGTLRFP